MNLADIKNHIFKGTKTNANQWGTTYSDMAIALNNWENYVNAIIRPFNSEYVHTDWAGSDINTGTGVPKFNKKFHEILPLGVELDYLGENVLKSQSIKAMKFRMIESAMRRWYAHRRFRVCSITIAAPGVITLDNHGFNQNDRVIFETSGSLPTGLTADTTWYYVVYLTQHTFALSATRSGSTITTTGSQSGTHFVGSERRPRITANDYDSCE